MRWSAATISRTVVMLTGALTGAALLGGCSLGADPDRPGSAAPPSPPPDPPAACMLDTAALATATGLTWTPDATTASDTRCVYDPAAGAPTSGVPTSGTPTAGTTAAGDDADGPAFVAVDVAPTGATAANAALDTAAAACRPTSRSEVPTAGGGFVCRFEGGSVFAAAVRGGRLVTVSASAVPAGTTTAQLVTALREQLGALR
ncbi:hypothetical protein [Pseudonocardia xinjiangensis]|uniref:DUF3558 domain-containing protein n=1 Tax=Pseudonocardia xinjiangensis TaxID=75289 RepID=A0ABX1RPB3_9PSEU|nr:hypothetical protein [Pseudonocardia xinjiangensis]NMH81817.1 hypothetical protein [Pseudonocardia xinjiangensis]